MFSGTGKINIRYISLNIDPSLKPVAQPLRRTPFNLRHKVMHVLGTQDIADPLSHSIDGKGGSPEHKHEAEQYVRFVAIIAKPRAMNTREVEETSATDGEQRNVRRAIKIGCFDDCKLYARIAGDLCVISLLVLRGTCIILPAKL